MAIDPEAAEVKASGGVVWRRAAGGLEVALVHRPRYDDWSLPKGKLDAGESWEDAALREVEEEIGLRCRLGARAAADRLPRQQGPREGRPLLDDGAARRRVRRPTTRSTRCAGSPPDEAAGLLSYDRDRELLREVEAAVNRDRFPGLRDGWARLDGPAGTQMVDAAIEAMADLMRSGRNANHGGAVRRRASDRRARRAARARAVGALLGGDPRGVAFGPSMTAMTMRFAAAAGRDAAARRRDRLHAPGPRRERPRRG